MGTDWSSKAIIGVEVPRSALYAKSTVKAFEHSLPASMKFDPQTGKPLWKEVEGPKFDEFDGKKLLGKWDVVVQYLGERTDYFYIVMSSSASGSNRSGEYKNMSPLDIESLASRFREFKHGLEILNLWDESSFGLWSLTEAG